VSIRVALASAVATLFALSIHHPRNAWPPVICNGGFTDGVVFVLSLFVAMLFVEGFHWLGWLMRPVPSASPAAGITRISERRHLPLGRFGWVLVVQDDSE